MSFKAEHWAWSQRGLSPAQKVVLLGLAQHSDRDNETAFPSLTTLADDCDLSPSTVKDALSVLVDKELIIKEQRHRSDGGWTSSLYTLNIPPDFGYGRPNGGIGVGRTAAKGRPNGGIALNQSVNQEDLNQDTPNTLRRVSAPKGAIPDSLTEFHSIISGKLSISPSKEFWAEVERYKAIDLVSEARRMVVWLDDHPRKRKGTNSFVLNWLARAGQQIVRENNDQRTTAGTKTISRPNPFAAYG